MWDPSTTNNLLALNSWNNDKIALSIPWKAVGTGIVNMAKNSPTIAKNVWGGAKKTGGYLSKFSGTLAGKATIGTAIASGISTAGDQAGRAENGALSTFGKNMLTPKNWVAGAAGGIIAPKLISGLGKGFSSYASRSNIGVIKNYDLFRQGKLSIGSNTNSLFNRGLHTVGKASNVFSDMSPASLGLGMAGVIGPWSLTEKAMSPNNSIYKNLNGSFWTPFNSSGHNSSFSASWH